MANRKVVFGLLGTTLDAGKGAERWSRWRPTVSVFQQQDFVVDEFHFISSRRFSSMALAIVADIRGLSPETTVVEHLIEFDDPWDFEEVYGKLLDLTEQYSFDPEANEYLFHITTGTHVAQICIFLLAESRRFPGKLLQTSPVRGENRRAEGRLSIVDLDLSRYDRIASRFQREARDDIAFLKSGIETLNPQFNQLIELIERVAIRSSEPILLTGPTGAGKSRLARQIYELKRQRSGMKGQFVELNCATLRGDAAMSTLFGHIRGSYTGAIHDRKGLLCQADGGMIFLDEIGELGLDEQAMLLHAIEEKRFLSVGADQEVSSDFQIMCGTNRDLLDRVEDGKFREDLLARINLWTFRLPGLKERPEDILPNIEFELKLFEQSSGTRVSFGKEALGKFLAFSTSMEALWTANFRDLKASVLRMSTLAQGARIGLSEVGDEIERLREAWRPSRRFDRTAQAPESCKQALNGLDEFDRCQVTRVIEVCRQSSSLAEAGRYLFATSRLQKSVPNDSDRLKKYLSRFGLDWDQVRS